MRHVIRLVLMGLVSVALAGCGGSAGSSASDDGPSPPARDKRAAGESSAEGTIPAGHMDVADGEQLGGWARDPHGAVPVELRIVCDGPLGKGKELGSVRADQPRPDLPFASKNHGFSIPVTQFPQLADGRPHTLYLYAVDSSRADSNVLLDGCPCTIPAIACPQPASAGSSARRVGHLDVATSEQIAGWAKDPDSDVPVLIRVVCEVPGRKIELGKIRADQPRPDLPFTNKRHGFCVSTAQFPRLLDGQPHKIHFYVIDPDGVCPDAEIENSPRQIARPQDTAAAPKSRAPVQQSGRAQPSGRRM